jgi:hypothetical protein
MLPARSDRETCGSHALRNLLQFVRLSASGPPPGARAYFDCGKRLGKLGRKVRQTLPTLLFVDPAPGGK